MQLCYPTTFGDISSDFYYEVGTLAQSLTFAVCAFMYIGTTSNRGKSVFLIMVLYSVYTNIMSFIFGEVNAAHYLAETLVFTLWTLSVMLRTDISTNETLLSTLRDHNEKGTHYNKVLLAFYKGPKGSRIMNFFELFGLPVKSLCIIAGDKCLVLKSSKGGFQFANSDALLKKKNEYLIVDTGKRHTHRLKSQMEEQHGKHASKFGFRIRCIEGVSDLLESIDQNFKPKHIGHNIPSWYLKEVV